MLVQKLITDYYLIKQMNNKVQTRITDYYDKSNTTKVYGYNSETDSWHCLVCGDDMGPTNPRQLCGKYFCYNKIF